MKRRSFVSGAVSFALVAATAIPIINSNTAYAIDCTAAAGSKAFGVVREVSGVSNPVTNTFGYTITADTDNPATVSDFPTTLSAVFNGVAPVSGKATVTACASISDAAFTKLGDYRFEIRENSSTDTTNYPISTNVYTVIFSVRNVLNNNVPTDDLEVTLAGYVDGAGTKVTDPIYSNAASRTYFQFTSAVTGNMSEKSQCFKYRIEIPVQTGVTSGDTYTLEANTTCTGSSDSVVAGSTNNYVYLKHGDSATVGLVRASYQLPVGISYTITKIDDTDSGYTTTVDGATEKSITKTTVAVDDADFNTLSKTEYVHDKSADVLTGIVTNVWIWILAVVLGAAGIIYATRNRKQKEEA